MNDRDKVPVVPVVETCSIWASLLAAGACILREHGLDVELVLKLHEGRPHVLDAIKNQKVQIITTPSVKKPRRMVVKLPPSLAYKIPMITTIADHRRYAIPLCKATTLDKAIKITSK